jgi:hypothetical protein
MNIFGIDYSISSPAVVKFEVNTNYNISTADPFWFDYIGFTSVKKIASLDSKILYYNLKDFSDNFERFNFLRTECL